MNYITIVGKADNFTVVTSNKNVPTVIVLDNVSEDFIRGVHYLYSTYPSSSLRLFSNLTLPGLSNNVLCDSNNLLHDIATINDYNNAVTEIINKYKACERYTARVMENQEVLIHFDTLDFLNGLYTLLNMISFSGDGMYDWTFAIAAVHDNGRFCHQYIKYDVTPDLKVIEHILRDIYYKVLVDIIIEYYPDACNSYETKFNDTGEYEFAYIHCDTPCEIDKTVCEICSHQTHNRVYKASVRLELAND